MQNAQAKTSSDGVIRLVVNAAGRRSTPTPVIVAGGLARGTRSLADGAADDVAKVFLGLLQPRLGRAAWHELTGLVVAALRWAREKHDPKVGPLKPFVVAALRRAYAKLVRDHGRRRLQLEWADEQLRDLAHGSEEKLLAYLVFAERQIRAVASVRPSRFWVPGLGRAELLAELRGEIWQAWNEGRLEQYERPGVASCVVFASAWVRKQQKRRRLVEVHEISADGATELAALRLDPPQLAQLLEAEAPRVAREELNALKAKASRRQKQWLGAMEADMAWHDGELNMERVAAQLGCTRSAGAHMKATLRRMVEARRRSRRGGD